MTDIVPVGGPMRFGIDDYYAYYFSQKKLMAVPLTGGSPIVIAEVPDGDCPNGDFVIRGNNVYFTDACNAEGEWGGRVFWVHW